jgi:succinate dehydrogenase hydrophobic anchor subunit
MNRWLLAIVCGQAVLNASMVLMTRKLKLQVQKAAMLIALLTAEDGGAAEHFREGLRKMKEDYVRTQGLRVVEGGTNDSDA